METELKFNPLINKDSRDYRWSPSSHKDCINIYIRQQWECVPNLQNRKSIKGLITINIMPKTTSPPLQVSINTVSFLILPHWSGLFRSPLISLLILLLTTFFLTLILSPRYTERYFYWIHSASSHFELSVGKSDHLISYYFAVWFHLFTTLVCNMAWGRCYGWYR